jgi:hypothetical protein
MEQEPPNAENTEIEDGRAELIACLMQGRLNSLKVI